MGKFETYQDKGGEYRFRLKANNGQTILSSEGYSAMSGCQNGIESVRKNAQDESRFEKLTNKAGKPYFNLKAGNGQVIGNSEAYESESARDNGIASVMKNAPDASVEEA